MQPLIIVQHTSDWKLDIPNVEVVASRDYLTDPSFSERRDVKVFNLCRSYRYQTLGYYVSLLATARGHKPVPDTSTIQDMKQMEIARIRSDGLDALIQKSLESIVGDRLHLSIYFGRCPTKRYERLAARLFQIFYAPLLEASFQRQKDGKWALSRVSPLSAGEISPAHHEFVEEVARQYFAAGRFSQPSRRSHRWDLAILVNPEEAQPPSNKDALQLFVKAAAKEGIQAHFITKEDYASLAEYDALFIREGTHVHHHTYRFAQRAQAEGMVVVDDPDSILRCTNKVFLAELLARHGVPTPRTMVVHQRNAKEIVKKMGLPCILKQPDSAFSQGVLKAETEREVRDHCEKLFNKSDLLIAQEFVPTDFDWRIGILEGKPLWCCKYYMAERHWQIMKWDGTSKTYGRSEAVAVEAVPAKVLKIALKAASLIGNGLYGVDLKQVGRNVMVVEVNDNPSLDESVEDEYLGPQLYREIMGYFRRRLERRNTIVPVPTTASHVLRDAGPVAE